MCSQTANDEENVDVISSRQLSSRINWLFKAARRTISAASSLFPIHEDVYHSLQNSVEKRVVTAMIFEDLKKFTELQKLALSIRAAQARPVVKEELYTDDVAQLQAILAQEKQKRKVIEEVYANLFESIEEHTEEK